MENKKMMWVWILIVLVVIAGLVFITINKKSAPLIQEVEQNIDMGNAQNVEGVKITVLKEGTGDVVAKAGDIIAVNYTGTFTNGEAFDSNVDPKFQHVEPFVFGLGQGQVIKGWDNGVVGMKIGEKRKLEIESAFAYGERGQGAIPPNAALVFEVELLGIKK